MALDLSKLRVYGGEGGRSKRSHWALRELGIDDKVEREGVPQGGNGGLYPKDEAARDNYRKKMHPDLRVPVLSVGPNHGDGFVLFESLAINYYLSKQLGHPLGPKNVEEEARIMSWSIWVHAQFEAQVMGLMMANFGKDKEKNEERKVPLRKQMERPLGALDTWLGAHKYMLGDDRWSIADLNVASVLQFGFDSDPGIVDNYPNLKRWWSETTSRPAYNAKTKSKM